MKYQEEEAEGEENQGFFSMRQLRRVPLLPCRPILVTIPPTQPAFRTAIVNSAAGSRQTQEGVTSDTSISKPDVN